MPLRFDFSRFDTVERTPKGGVKIPAAVTRVGIFTYNFPDGSERRELRPSDEVFSLDSLATLRDAPVTDMHPSEPVNAENYTKLTKGYVRDVKAENPGPLVNVMLTVQDAETVRKIEAGERKELSCGYRCDLDPTPGVYDGQRYDAIQRQIRYNHVALGPVGWGRAGKDVALRLDACDAVSIPSHAQEERKPVMKTIRIDGVDYEIGSDAHLAKIAADMAALTKRAELAEGRADSLSKDLDKAREDLKAAQDPARIDSAVAARVDLVSKARKILGPDTEIKGTDRDVMVAVLKADAKDLDLTGRSDDYVTGMFESTIAKAPVRTDARSVSVALGAAGAAGNQTPERTDAAPDADKARAAMVQANRKLATDNSGFSLSK